MAKKKENTEKGKVIDQMSLKDALTAVQIKKIQQEILDGIKDIRIQGEKEDLKYKTERAALAGLKRKQFEGELITRESAINQTIKIIEDLKTEISVSIEGIAKTKRAKVNKIFKKYLSE